LKTWSLTTWLGVSDLSYLMVQYWDVEVKRELEMPVLREYHCQLLANGVIGYDWDQLFADYKLCAVQAVYTVAEWCIKAEDRERMRWLWRLELERAMHAFFGKRLVDQNAEQTATTDIIADSPKSSLE
jgi:hypothetical protein